MNSNAVRAVRRRGNVHNGANYGPRYVNANNAPSNGNWNYGAALNPCQSKPKRFVSKLYAAFPGSLMGIKIPSDWIGLVDLNNRKLCAPGAEYGRRRDEKHETCHELMDKILQH